jgi:hypothetical protein
MPMERDRGAIGLPFEFTLMMSSPEVKRSKALLFYVTPSVRALPSSDECIAAGL